MTLVDASLCDEADEIVSSSAEVCVSDGVDEGFPLSRVDPVCEGGEGHSVRLQDDDARRRASSLHQHARRPLVRHTRQLCSNF